MAVTGVTDTSPVQQTQAQTSIQEATGMEGLGQDAFLQLLLAQLKNQDPLQPMDNTEFISQMAQLNSLNELMALNKTMSSLITAQMVTQGSALIGKTISASLDTGESVYGVVSGMQIHGDRVTLTVDGQQVPMDAVREVTDTPTDDGQQGGSAVW